MNRYIDADKAKEQIVNSFVTDIFCLTDDEVGRADKAILDEIDKVPTADVVEVVRCKDCLYATKKYGHIECINGISYRNHWNQPDDYCSYGERADMRGDKR